MFAPVRYTIREADVHEYLPVVGESYTAFGGDAAARAAGYERRVVPPSFGPFVAVIAMLRSFDWAEDLFFAYESGTAMFGEQELEYLRPLYVGETLRFQGRVSDVFEKRGKRIFDVVWLAFGATDERGEPVLKGAQSYLLFK